MSEVLVEWDSPPLRAITVSGASCYLLRDMCRVFQALMAQNVNIDALNHGRVERFSDGRLGDMTILANQIVELSTPR